MRGKVWLCGVVQNMFSWNCWKCYCLLHCSDCRPPGSVRQKSYRLLLVRWTLWCPCRQLNVSTAQSSSWKQTGCWGREAAWLLGATPAMWSWSMGMFPTHLMTSVTRYIQDVKIKCIIFYTINDSHCLRVYILIIIVFRGQKCAQIKEFLLDVLSGCASVSTFFI